MTHLVFGQPIRQPVHLHSDGRKRSHLRYPLTARTRNTQANNNFRLPDIDTSTPADHHILTSLRPPNPFPAMQPGGITPVNDAVRRAQSKQFAVPNAIPGSVFTPDSQHQETPSSPEPTRHHSHAIAAATGHASLRSSHWASTDVAAAGRCLVPGLSAVAWTSTEMCSGHRCLAGRHGQAASRRQQGFVGRADATRLAAFR